LGGVPGFILGVFGKKIMVLWFFGLGVVGGSSLQRKKKGKEGEIKNRVPPPWVGGGSAKEKL